MDVSVIDKPSVTQSLVEQLYHHYRQRMYHYAFAVVKDVHIAEDIVHDVVVKLLRYGDLYVDSLESEKTRALVRIVTVRTAINHYNKQKRRPDCYLDPEIIDRRIADSVDFVHQLEVWGDVDKLSPPCRDVVYLRVKLGYDYKQIGRLLGITPGAARKRFYDAKRYLRDVWGGDRHAD